MKLNLDNLGSWNLAVVLLAAAAVAGGCGRDGVKVYRVPKERSAALAQGDRPAGHPDVAAAGPRVRWVVPAGWQEMPPSEIRVGSFRVTGADGQQADVSVIPLAGQAGGVLGNVNRWRGQVGQPPVAEDELTRLAQPVEVAGQPAALYEQDGANPEGAPTRILAVIQQRDETAWFFKMTGASQLVALEKTIFVAFLKSVQFPGGEPGPASPVAAAAGAPAEVGTRAGQPQWVAPPGWTEVPGGQFLVAKFTIAGVGGAQAAVNVSSSAGDGGGLAANVNRWRKQLGLDELDGDELAQAARALPAAGGQVMVVEMSGHDARSGQPASLVGAMVLQPGQAWFYKLMGDAAVVAAQRAAFTRFVQEVKY